MAPTNKAVYQVKLGEPLEVRDAPYTKPGPDQLVVKAEAWAVNPVDHIIQNIHIFDYLKLPYIPGLDVSGTVHEVGSNVTSFKPGDRVLTCALGIDNNTMPESGFQLYPVVRTVMTSKVPDSLTFAEASVFPICAGTAASGLFEKKYLALDLPTERSAAAVGGNGKTVLVWSGASSVGSNAIQLAAGAGYEVLTTSSPANYELCKSLGASQVFDYKSADVADKIVAALSGKQYVGAFIAAGEPRAAVEIASKTQGSKFIACAPLVPEDLKVPEGITVEFVLGSSLEKSEVGPAIFGRFIPEGLAKGYYKVAPAPHVVAKGLEGIQQGYDMLKKGVSAKKIVITA